MQRRKKLVKRFPDRDITVGMDTALIVGNPSVISSALLLIPNGYFSGYSSWK